MSRAPAIDFIATTATTIDGYDVVQTFGIVRGIVVRSRSFVGTMGVVLQTLRGGNISLLEELCERTRADAYAKAVEHATALGGNGLLALRYDATEIMAGVSEVLCYGTAVRLAPRAGIIPNTSDFGRTRWKICFAVTSLTAFNGVPSGRDRS